jgi:hypothetical protein
MSNRPRNRARSRRHLALAAAVTWGVSACASTPDVDESYRPAENVLEVLAVLRAHIADDTYRFEPARDFTGRNVYRSTLLRLENLEQLHADALRAGHMDGVIAFAKARSLERLQAFDLAAESYRLAAELNDELATEAQRSADVCAQLHRAAEMNRELEPLHADEDPDELDAAEAPLEVVVDVAPPDARPTTEAVLAEFETRVSLLDELAISVEGTHHLPVVREEVERADALRASYFEGIRSTRPDGDVLAASELQRVITRHPDSKNFNRHLLALANLFAELAVEYVDANPPESLMFDPVRFRELIEGASRLYEMVASRDGTPEKLEASRRLEAFLAFSIQVDRDRFTP